MSDASAEEFLSNLPEYLQTPTYVLKVIPGKTPSEIAKDAFALMATGDDWVIYGRQGFGPMIQWTVMERREDGIPTQISYQQGKNTGIINV